MKNRGGGTGMIGRGGMPGSSGRIHRSKTHVLSFMDHRGKEALMIFEGRQTCPLPQLYSFSIYFTHAHASPSNIQPAELLEAITRNTPMQSYPCPFRLDVYFVPVAGVQESDEACIAHYHEEKRSRGDYTRQIEALETSIKTGSVSRTGGLPGYVPTYVDIGMWDLHHGLLYSYQGVDWHTNNQMARCVHFDPIPQEEYARLAEEAGEDMVLEPVYVALRAFQQSDTERDGPKLVGMSMCETAHVPTENQTIGPWQEAVELGWSTW